MSSKKKESLVIALLLLVFSVILFFSATRIPVSGALGAGADFLPKVGSVLLFCCACSFLVQFVRTPKEEGEAAAKAPDLTPAVRFFLALGLLAGGLTMVAAMLLWNWLITPYYMGYPREAVTKLLLPAFLPFNLLKAGLNGLGIFLLCPPVAKALSKAGLIDHKEDTYEQPTRP